MFKLVDVKYDHISNNIYNFILFIKNIETDYIFEVRLNNVALPNKLDRGYIVYDIYNNKFYITDTLSVNYSSYLFFEYEFLNNYKLHLNKNIKLENLNSQTEIYDIKSHYLVFGIGELRIISNTYQIGNKINTNNNVNTN